MKTEPLPARTIQTCPAMSSSIRARSNDAHHSAPRRSSRLKTRAHSFGRLAQASILRPGTARSAGFCLPTARDRRHEVRISARLQSGRKNSGAKRLPWFGRVSAPDLERGRDRTPRLPPKISESSPNPHMWKVCQEPAPNSKVITQHPTPLTPLYPQRVLAGLLSQSDILNL
jgi:hypothetical protein